MNGNDERNQRLEYYISSLTENSCTEMREFSQYLSDIALATRYNYLVQVNDFLTKTGKRPGDLQLGDYIADLAAYKYKANGEEVTSGAQLTRYFALKRLSEFLYVYKYAEQNYMLDVKKPKATESEKTLAKREAGVLSADEVRILMEDLHSDIENLSGEDKDMAKRNLAIFYIFLTTGIRQNALVALDLDDVDLKNHILRVTDKGRKSRMIDICDECANAIEDWLKARGKEVYKSEKDALFITHRVKHAYTTIYSVGYLRIEPWEIDRLVKEKTKFTGRNLSAHKLRATYGTMLYKATNDIYFVQSCMGHASPSTTERYIRGIHGNSKKASGLMANIINGKED